MYSDEKHLSDLKLEIGLLKKDNEQLVTVTNKLSDTIEKIQEMNGNLVRMLALHDQKHENHVKIENDLKDDIKDLHSRITTVTRELYEKVSFTEKHLGDKIDNLRSELKNHQENDEKEKSNKLAGVLKEIDKYKWMILGAAAAIGWIIGNINLTALDTIIK
jgi:chromosome segregation ATPase